MLAFAVKNVGKKRDELLKKKKNLRHPSRGLEKRCHLQCQLEFLVIIFIYDFLACIFVCLKLTLFVTNAHHCQLIFWISLFWIWRPIWPENAPTNEKLTKKIRENKTNCLNVSFQPQWNVTVYFSVLSPIRKHRYVAPALNGRVCEKKTFRLFHFVSRVWVCSVGNCVELIFARQCFCTWASVHMMSENVPSPKHSPSVLCVCRNPPTRWLTT